MRSLETLNRSNDLVTRLLKTSGCSNGLVICILAFLWIFCRMTCMGDELRYSLKKFNCWSGHLTQCFQDLFDFICTSLSALNSYFALFKTTRIPKCRSWSGFFFRCSRLWAFQRPQSLIRRTIWAKGILCKQNVSKETRTLLLSHVYITNELFFCQLLVLRKKTRRIKEARVIRALLIQMDSVALPITHVYFMQIW